MYDVESFEHCFGRARAGVMLDIGANVGRVTRTMATKATTVYAFEPGTLNFNELAKNVKDLPNVVPVHAAVGNVTGEIPLYLHSAGEVSEGHTISNVTVETGGFGHEFARKEIIAGWRLDDWCEVNNITDISFIKIDVEAAEEYVLEGAQKTLTNNDCFVSLEIHQTVNCQKIYQYLVDCGYTVTENGYDPSDIAIHIPGYAYVCYKK
jgi:FkbM family methyltransferase